MRIQTLVWLIGLALETSALANTSAVRRWSQPPVSSDQYESHPMFDPRNGDLYFVRSTPEFEHWQLMLSRCDRDGHRAPPAPPPFAAANAAEADPFFTRDGSTLYFISTRPVNDVPKSDLDLAINTPGDEFETELSANGKRMLLMADDDLYVSRIVRGHWAPRVKLGVDVNSAGMEVGGYLSPNAQSFLFSRDGEIYQYGTAANFPPRCHRR